MRWVVSGSLVLALIGCSIKITPPNFNLNVPSVNTTLNVPNYKAPNVNLPIGSSSTTSSTQGSFGLEVAATPANSVEAQATITLSSITQGMTGTPSFSFTTTEPGITITPGASGTATIEASSSSTEHDFFVAVTATSSNEQTTAQVHLVFTTTQSLQCQMTYHGSNLTIGQAIPFQIMASDGEALQIVYFSPGPGGTYSGPNGASMSVTYSQAGPKFVTAFARSVASGTYCNGGYSLQNFVVIQP